QLAESGADLTDGLALLRNASERAVRIARELLECCRGPAPRARPPSRDWFALGPFLKSLAEEQAVAARAKRLELGADLAAAQGWEVHSEPVRLGRLLGNLLVNAVRYTPRGGIALRAAWRQESRERLLEISVTDTGPGIPKEEH